ncbi:MAG: beta-phosphoglucomutase [Clostridiales bacterium]|jgi:beta-phosphoglucomutase|nr:beta-phosphoglucomutase [Clostridiales bacterium]
MGYKAVIFDLDGVICHTDRYHYSAWKEIADEIGVYFDEKINNNLRGISRKESLEIILRNYKKTLTQEQKNYYLSKKNELYKDMLKSLSPLDIDPIVLETIKKIKEANIKTAIASSSRNAKLILNQLGLEKTFDAVVDGNDIRRSKPDPEVFLKASSFLNIPPKDCLVVEDAESGVRAAHAAGMDCAAIGDATKYNLAKYSLIHLSDLLNILSA